VVILVDYPMTPDEWQIWIESHLDISKEEGTRILLSNLFPIEKLVEKWNQEFDTEKGYSTGFIPALIRNKIGFLIWVYDSGTEPYWKDSDSTG
jgi:hypothetical protein